MNLSLQIKVAPDIISGPGWICNSKSGPGRIWKNHIRCNPTTNGYWTVLMYYCIGMWK